jgi:hypothetical protein
MRSPPLVVAALLALAASPLPAQAEPPTSPPGTATLPLADLLALQRDRDREAPAPAPPVRAAVNRLEIAGRLLDTGLDATADVAITVVGEGWVAVPILELGGSTHLAGLPMVDAGATAIVDGRLCLVTDRPGVHALTVRWFERAAVRERSRSVALRVPPGTPAVLRLEHDQSLFRLTSDAARVDGTATVLHASAGRIAVAWQATAAGAARAQVAARPPVEPVVTTAHASIVATLEGRRISRVQYALRFEGQRTFSVALPPGQAVERVFLNGAATRFAQEGDRVAVQVTPARAGDQTASVEVVTTEAQRGYPLSGTLAFAVPQPAWGVNDLFVTLHLPPVFEYRWTGGSLASAEQGVQAPPFAWDIPTPGKTLALRQQLVGSVATAQVAYTVDLSTSYYR